MYTPDGSGIVLSLDNYLQTHPKYYRAFQQNRNCDNNGSIKYTGKNNKVIILIELERNHNGQWLTKSTNQILLLFKSKKYIIHKVRICSATIQEKPTMKITITITITSIDDSIKMMSKKTTIIINDNNNNYNNNNNNNNVSQQPETNKSKILNYGTNALVIYHQKYFRLPRNVRPVFHQYLCL